MPSPRMPLASPRMPLVWILAIVTSLLVGPVASGEPGTSRGLDVPGDEVGWYFDPETSKRIIPNARCLKCHGDEKKPTDVRDDGSIVEIYVPPTSSRPACMAPSSATTATPPTRSTPRWGMRS